MTGEGSGGQGIENGRTGWAEERESDLGSLKGIDLVTDER